MKILVNNCFPLTYTDEFYSKVPILYKDFARLFILKEIAVGGVLCRLEIDKEEDKEDKNNNKEKK